MACPTCDHSMAGVVPGLWYCERCGTLKGMGDTVISVPKLVERCRQFERDYPTLFPATVGDVNGLWCRLGIRESIRLPEERT